MSTARSWLFAAAVTLMATPLGACEFDEDANPAHNCGACPAGQCHNGFCLSSAAQDQFPATTGGSSGAVAGSDAAGSSDTGQPGPGGSSGSASGGSAGTTMPAAGTTAPPVPCNPGSTCYSADQATKDVGVCRAGQCDDAGMCAGEVSPGAEACNSLDDDCDGEVDEDVALGQCTATGGAGACQAGTMACEQGVAACRAGEPQTEQCNGSDDDCDGEVDNDVDASCYPDGATGCTRNASGALLCAGRCAAGVRHCVAGAMAECTGFTVPAAESCGDDDAGDEDCDGKVDEGCSCSGSQTQRCYPGPILTLGFGTCRRGEQQCVNGAFGPCTGAVVPVDETCANIGADNDCDLVVDDVPTLGFTCLVAGQRGVCRSGELRCSQDQLKCIGPAPAAAETICDGLDENCNGQTDETFAFATDEAHCGQCTISCASNELCCAGGCIKPATDPNNCGACGNSCGSNRACCNGTCVNTNTVDHCGGCGGCVTGQACCGGACVDTNTIDHCGGCGGCVAGQACCGGSCVNTNTADHCGSCGGCTGGQDCCGGACVNTNTVEHCGGCGACGPGDACCGSSCVTPNTVQACGASCAMCAGGQQCCGGGCVDTNTEQHCGGCQGCGTGETCCGGTSCVDTKTNVDNCGGCNQPCGMTCCDGGCTDPMMDIHNCGMCGNNCPDGCGCVGGTCQTPEGQACLQPG